jgi:hypothetical protein
LPLCVIILKDRKGKFGTRILIRLLHVKKRLIIPLCLILFLFQSCESPSSPEDSEPLVYRVGVPVTYQRDPAEVNNPDAPDIITAYYRLWDPEAQRNYLPGDPYHETPTEYYYRVGYFNLQKVAENIYSSQLKDVPLNSTGLKPRLKVYDTQVLGSSGTKGVTIEGAYDIVISDEIYFRIR